MFFGGNQADQIKRLITGVKTPEVEAKLPEVEAMPLDARIALVKYWQSNLRAIISQWKKFGPLLEARGMDKRAVAKDLKVKKQADKHLQTAMNLVDDRKIQPPFRKMAEGHFNVLVAWMMLNEGAFVDVLRTGRDRSPKAILESLDKLADAEVKKDWRTVAEDDEGLPSGLVADAAMDGPADARDIEESEDLIEKQGGSRVFP